MIIGLLQLQFRLPENHSLKGKRQVLLGLKQRVRQRFNVSVSETDNHDKWQLISLSLVTVARDRAGVSTVLNQVVEFCRKDRDAELTDVHMELF